MTAFGLTRRSPTDLRAWDYHTVWCNTEAIRRAGITADTPDPSLGEIPHRDDGSVLGMLREWGAVDLVLAMMPPQCDDVRIEALGTAADYLLARGVTWVQDARVEPADVATYRVAAEGDELRMRFKLALYADPRSGVRIGSTEWPLVRLDRDPRQTPALQLPAIGVRATYLEGRQVYLPV